MCADRWIISAHGVDQIFCSEERIAVELINTATMLLAWERGEKGFFDVAAVTYYEPVAHHMIPIGQGVLGPVGYQVGRDRARDH